MRLAFDAAAFVAAAVAPAAAQAPFDLPCPARIEWCTRIGTGPNMATARIMDRDNARFGASTEPRRLRARWGRDLGALPG